MKITKYLESAHLGTQVMKEDSWQGMLDKRDSAFKTYEIVSETIKVDGNLIELKSEKLKEKSYFIGSFMTVEQVENIYGRTSNIYQNIIKNDYKGICVYKTPQGHTNTHLISKDDIVLDSNEIRFRSSIEDKFLL